jgi:ribose transport system substrate-binding protein
VIAAVINKNMQKQLRIVGCDQNLNLLYRIRHGELDGLVVQDMRQMGKDAVQQVMAQRRGDPVPEKTLVPSRLVTADNIDDPAIQQMLKMDWRLAP